MADEIDFSNYIWDEPDIEDARGVAFPLGHLGGSGSGCCLETQSQLLPNFSGPDDWRNDFDVKK